MLDTNNVKTLDPRDVAIWARQVFAEKLIKLTQARLVARTCSSGPEAADNMLWDQATAHAWKHIEAHGINAQWPTHASDETSTLLPKEENAGNRMLSTLTDDMKSAGRTANIKSSFERSTCQSITAAQHFVQLMQTYIQAMAHAHRTVSDLEEGRAAGLRDMLDATRCEMIALENNTFREQGVVHSNVKGDDFELTAAISTASDKHDALHQVSAATSPTPDPAMMAVVARIMDDKRADNMRVATVTQYGSCIELFTKVTGVTDGREVTQTKASAFRDGLRRIS